MVVRSVGPAVAVVAALLLLLSCIALPCPAARKKAPGANRSAATPAADVPPIEVTCAGSMAPLAVHVHALGENPETNDDPALVHNRYEWDFGDAAGRWNRLGGFNAAHVYNRPGTYVVTLTVTNPAGRVTRREVKVHVAPDTRRRVFVSSTSGDDTNTGLHERSAVKTAGRAFALAGNNTAVLFRAGETFDIPETIKLKARNLLVGAYGAKLSDGAKRGHERSPRPLAPLNGKAALKTPPADRDAPPPMPVLRKIEGKSKSMFFVDGKSRDVVVQGVLFDSVFTLDGKHGDKKVPARAFTVGGVNVAVRGCAFRNLTDAVNTEQKPTGVLVQDNTMGDELRGYGVWGEGRDHVYVGNTMTHSRQEHLIRTSGPGVRRLLIAHNDLSRPDNKKGSIELRRAEWFTVAANRIAGGTLRVGPQEQDPKKVPDWADMKCRFGVVEGNRLENVFVNVRLGTEHLAVRNNAIAYDNGEAILIECVKPGYDHVRRVVDLTIERNTATNAAARGKFLKVSGRAAGIRLKNNLYVAPNLKCESVHAAAVDVRDKDLSGFTEIDGNVWPATAGPPHRVAEQGVAPAAWNNAPQVGADRCADASSDRSAGAKIDFGTVGASGG